MRNFLRSTGADPFFAIALALILAGCSTGSSNTIQTSSLAPVNKPSYAEAPRKYVDPGHPTPREFAAASDQYGLEGDRSIQTASIGEPRRTPYYDSEPRWRQPTSGITTGSTGYSGSAGYGAPGPRHTPHTVVVREGDTLYGLSHRYNVPVKDLVAANRLPSERIAIGQQLVIPIRYR